ncbi:RNA polymerase II-binding domain-containing protein [Xylaria bambusicola]|uniref:RNA polymerase II-binding domain-containing protein n=1 Tax=Xylaria bambusicola TaxID=326684 RepID=UPI002007710A|nr:RNA polymerase II-binding domain-containing protein [Xylaria bambusicola]KAI0515357.1 RNA polymerase II-binding domain-containing protein [Xylaria bambusicola]
MAYNDDAVLAKLSSLSETQDSIVSVAQWIMFYRRHADRTAQLWLQKLKDSSSHKRLSLIYLANEVAQQSKARRKEEFLVSFSPAIAEAVAVAYKGAPHDVQQRIRRVVDVWRDRGVFEGPIQQAVEARIHDLDKARGSTKAGLGGSIFGSASACPAELTPLVAPQQNVTKVALSTKPTMTSANKDYDGLMAPGSTVPSAPVYAARLSGLLKTLAQAEGAVEQSVKARRELVNQLQKLLDANRNALIEDENELENVMQKRLKVEDKKEEIEKAIMAGLPNDEPYPTGNAQEEEPAVELDRPEVEALTPLSNDEDFEPEPNPAPEWSPEFPPEDTDFSRVVPTMQTTSSIGSPSKSVEISANGAKKRRLEDTSDFPDLGGDGIEADVAEILRKDSSSN